MFISLPYQANYIMNTNTCNSFLVIFALVVFAVNIAARELYYDWTASFSQLSPLGFRYPKKVIVINDQFPGPLLEAVSNDVVSINVHNNLDEPFLLTWNGVDMRKNSWQDGVQETNCPIMPGQNWTYRFQIKDQIGSYFYFPSILFQKAAGGYGAIRVNNPDPVPIPFPPPDYDYDILIGDWFNDEYVKMRSTLDEALSLPDGILINGLGPYQATFDFAPGGTYRLRISNVGLKTTLNFRIQNHNMLLVETEGTYTVKQYYENLDIHVGQSYSVIVTSSDQAYGAFYMTATSRFIPLNLVGIGIVRYSGFQGEPLDPIPPLPVPPNDFVYDIVQALSIRMDLFVGAARRNPQGSFHYGSINITRTLYLENGRALFGETYRNVVNNVSFKHPDTPLKLADYYQLSNIFEPGNIRDGQPFGPPRIGLSVIDATNHDFVHVVLQNPLPTIETWHADGYSFFVVGMGIGIWDEGKMESYNMVDAIYRSTIQVYPLAWTAILIKLDSIGMWNLRSQDAEKWYLGQELYIRVKGSENDPTKISPRDETPIPANVMLCGRISHT